MISYKKAILNTKAYKTLMKDSESRHLSHTYLLVSEDMEYIKEFAKMQAQVLLEIINDEIAINKVEKNIHPDVLMYGDEEKINTKTVTGIASDVFVRPYELNKKVYILLNMNDANDEAQNKLLKTIEEPPKNVYFILGSTNERKLLPTVLSRAKKIELDLIDNETISSTLENEGFKRNECDIFSACAGGVFSRAYKMATDKEFLALYQNVFKCLNKMSSSRDVLYFSSIFNSKDVDKVELADLFMLIARDVCMAKLQKNELVNNVHKIEELKIIAEQFSFEALYKIIEYCLLLKEDLVYNTNATLAVDEFLLKLTEVKVKCKK